MVTEGSISTQASGTASQSIGFSLPGGASSVTMTLTPLVGSPVNATCNSSPCVVASAPKGANLQLVQYYSGAGGSGSIVWQGSSWLP